jgi:hypothetical protein
MMMLDTRSMVVALCLLVAGAAVPAWAAETLNYNYRHELLDTPMYDPVSKSYYEMVDGAHGMVKGTGVDTEGPNWREAVGFASTRVYKGVHGRLATVSDLETHEFLERTFQPKTLVWIGLRYLCTGQLEEVTGKMRTQGSFMIWARDWRRTAFGCQKDTATGRPLPGSYMPVAYTAVTDGFQWIAQGTNKRFYYFFVEYPTGRP